MFASLKPVKRPILLNSIQKFRKRKEKEGNGQVGLTAAEADEVGSRSRLPLQEGKVSFDKKQASVKERREKVFVFAKLLFSSFPCPADSDFNNHVRRRIKRGIKKEESKN